MRRCDVGAVRRDEPLSAHCTWRIGGPADVWVEPQTVEQLQRLISLLRRSPLPHILIGDGSNLLFDDAGFRGVVVAVGRALAQVEIEGTRVRAQAGVAMARLARKASLAGLSGLEHTVGIPGTLGGLIHMNGGSLRRSIGQVVRTVRYLEPDGALKHIAGEACGFAYRTSGFQGSGRIIVEAELMLARGEPDAIRREMLDILRARRRNFPRRLPSCGSVFLSDPDRYATDGPTGRVIEESGCKGWRSGDAEVSRQHANFIVNRGRARAADVLALIDRVRRAVHARTGRWLRCEVRFVAADGPILPVHDVLD